MAIRLQEASEEGDDSCVSVFCAKINSYRERDSFLIVCGLYN